MVYERYRDQGFEILAFPCNQFRVQEPGSNFEVDRSVGPAGAPGAEFPEQPYPFFAKMTVNEGPILCQPGAGDGSCNRGELKCSDSDPVHCQPTSTRCCMSNNNVYDYLKSELPGELDWNFAKFLVGRDGIPISRYLSIIEPFSLTGDIEAALAVKSNWKNATRPAA